MSGDPPMQYLRDRLQETADAQTMTVYCLMCPDWAATGTAGEARAASETHRKTAHPDLKPGKRTVRKSRVFSQKMTAEREAQIDEERRQRMRALGIPGD